MNKYSKTNLEIIIKNCNNWNDLEKLLQLKKGNSRSFLSNKIKEFNLDISHFLKKTTKTRINSIELFKDDSQEPRGKIRNRVIKEKLIPYICECCGQDENWRGKIMPLILDHKNGINNDHRLENLRFLCSNCDSIQDTYKSKNKNGIKVIKKNYIPVEKGLVRLKQKNERIKLWEENILKAQINFSKKTWGTEVGKLMNKSSQYSLSFVKENLQHLLNGQVPE